MQTSTCLAARDRRAARGGSDAARSARAGDVHSPAETRRIRPDGSGHEASRPRLRSLDALRGLAIVVMLMAGNPFLREHLTPQLKHPQWHGLTFADLFFPLFLFVVGIAMTLSRRTGSTRLVLKRVTLLVLLGVVLSSFKHGHLVPTGVLQHIAGSYLIAWLVLRAPRRFQAPLGATILIAVWAGFVLWPGEAVDPWSQSGTFAHAVNEWTLGGFATEGVLQTTTSAVTVVGGALIGRGVQERREPRRLWRWVAAHAAWLIVVAMMMAIVVPINKRIWTPSFTLLTLGSSCAMFAVFIWLIDVRRIDRFIAPLEELGANPVAIYVGFITVRAVIADYRHVVPELSPFDSKSVGALLYSGAWVVVGWVFAHLLFRRKIFLRL